MREKDYREEGRPEDLLQELGYETADIKYKQFAVYGVYFFGFFFACILLGFVAMYLMSPTKLTGPRMGDYVPKTTMPLSAPLLQSNITARTDIMSLRRKESAILDTSGVVDQAHGVYRIPVDTAIDDIARESDSQRAAMGLPPATAPVTASNTTSTSNPATAVSAAAKPVSTSGNKPASNRGESATTKPKGGKGG